jgi:anthranilate synthase component 1
VIMSLTEARRLAYKGNVVPLHEKVPADLDTPVSVYLKLASRSRKSFLLESIEGGEKISRYSFIGCDPLFSLYGFKDHVVLQRGRKRSRLDTFPIEFIDELFRQYKPVAVPGLPRFTGGGVGYFAYDTIGWFERLPETNPDPINMPPIALSLFESIIVYDHLRQEILLIANIMNSGRGRFRDKYDRARERLEQMKAALHKTTRSRHKTPQSHRRQLKAHYSKKEFEAMVRKGKHYIREGDIFQVVLSQRWQLPYAGTALDLYRGLRRVNPSPYMYLIRDGEMSVIGSSPEMLVRVEDRLIETRPIAGTRRRGKNSDEDERLETELLADPKELAEHTMLLDLGRNDIGRVAEGGSVKVKDYFIVERYSHVMHIVSSVTGKLQKRVSPLQALYACFPAGTVSGAPKIRAMEIIDELEKHKRGVYAGAVGYIDFHGNLDSCIAIRTMLKKGNTVYVQAGAGIVADSRPAREYEETREKARALLAAIDLIG